MTNINAMNKAELIEFATDASAEAQRLQDQIDAQDVHTAMQIIADQFNDPRLQFNRQLGEQVEVNGMAFVQKNILGSIIYGLEKKHEWFADKLREDIAKVEKAHRQVVNDELGMQQLDRVIMFAENRKTETLAIEQLLNAAKAIYGTATGEAYMPYTPAPTGQQNSKANELERRMAAFGVKASLSPTNTDGITSEEEVADRNANG